MRWTIFSVMLVVALNADAVCNTCISQTCKQEGNREICEEFEPPLHGCVSSGMCSGFTANCAGEVGVRLASVEVEAPTPEKHFLGPWLELAQRRNASQYAVVVQARTWRLR